MGMLIEGVWYPDDAAARVGPRGEFVRTQALFRNTISEEHGALYFRKPTATIFIYRMRVRGRTELRSR
jgi:glutathionyl-hydroquinone reductase